MKKTIILLLDQADIDALPTVAEFIRQNPTEYIFVLHNPQLGLDRSQDVSALDEKIDALNREADAAAARRDTLAFGDFVQKINDLRTQRDLALTKGFKEIAADRRQAAYAAMLKPMAGLAREMVAYPLPEPFESGDYVQALHSVARNNYHPKWITWKDRDYSILNPQSVTVRPVVVPKNEKTSVSESAKVATTAAEVETPEDYEYQLRKLRHYAFIGQCRQAGIQYTKGPKDDAIRALIAKRFPQPQAA